MALLEKDGGRIQWTESDNLLLIEAVIRVEEENGETVHKSSMRMQPGEKKWDRIHSLVPEKLQGRMKGANNYRYRCSGQFFNLVRNYKAQMKGRKSGHMVTKRILEMLKRREDLRSTISSTNIHSSNTQASNSKFSSDHANERSQKEFSSDHANERSQKDFNNPRERQDGVASRSVSTTEYRDRHKSPAKSTKPRLVSESKDREDLGEPSTLHGARTRAQTSRRAPSPDAVSNSTRKSYSTKMAQTSFEEGLQGVSDEPLRRLDEEFCNLNSWVKSRLIPLGKNDFNQMTISALRSSKRLKLSTSPTTKPFENLFQESLSKAVDHHIQATFHNLRVRLAQLLKQTSVEMTQFIIEDSAGKV